MLNNLKNQRKQKNQKNHNGRRLKTLRLLMSMMSSANQSFQRKKKNKKKPNLNKREDSNPNKIKKTIYKRKSKLYLISLKRSEHKEKKYKPNSTTILSHLLK